MIGYFPLGNDEIDPSFFGDRGNLVFHQVQIRFHRSRAETLLMQSLLAGSALSFDAFGLLFVASRFRFVELFFSC